MTVDRRFRGPTHSANGGYTAGLLAGAFLGCSSSPSPPIQVRLHLPPPLGVPLEVAGAAGLSSEPRATLRSASTVVAEAAPGSFAYDAVAPVSYDVAAATEPAYAGWSDHPFSECFVCGPDRGPGDGLRLFPGPLDTDRTACGWAPDPTVSGGDGLAELAVVWAALDCPGGWTAGLAGRPMVLGTMTSVVWRRPRVGEPCVITGRRDRAEERRTWTSTALFGSDGDLFARAEAIWVAVDPAVFNRLRS